MEDSLVEEFVMRLAALVGSLTVIGAGAGLAYRRWMLPTLKRLDAAAELIQAQMTINGGHSLLDIVKRNDRTLQNLVDVQLKDIERRLASIASIEERLSKIEFATTLIAQSTPEPSDDP